MSSCIFCQIVAGKSPSWKVLEDDHCYAFLDINPINPYHTLIIPKDHYQDMFDLPASVATQVMQMTKKVIDLYAVKLGLNNLQVINSSGVDAQQDVFHVHFHVVPRERGDGQNISWQTHPELRERYDEMIRRLA